jgi:voltage-gated potassium channel
MSGLPESAPIDRLSVAEQLAARLDRPMGVLGLIFVFVVLGQVLSSEPWMVTTFTVLSWVFWAVFVAEFILRAHVAGWSRQFWRRNWWQLLFLAVPFLRFFRALALFRFARVARIVRVGGVLSAGVRGSRSAGRLLSSRLSWLAAVTVVVILASSQLYYVVDGSISYGDALYEAALTAVTGQGLVGEGVFVRILRLSLATYSVVVFATLAGSLGAYFLQRPQETPAPDVELA